MDYLTLKEASEKWGITPRQIDVEKSSLRKILIFSHLKNNKQISLIC